MNDNRQTTNSPEETTAAGDDRDVLAELVRAAGRRPLPAEDDRSRVFAASQRAWRQAVQVQRRRRRYLALAASVAALAIGGTIVSQLTPTTPLPVIASTAVMDGQVLALAPRTDEWRAVGGAGDDWVAGTRLRTSAGSRVSLNLASGGSLRVDESTEMTLTSSERLVLIAGTMYFDSGTTTGTPTGTPTGAATGAPTGTPSEAGTLEVVTSHGLVRKTGTQFEVMSTPASLRVRVREGSVEIEREQQLAGLTGTAGEQLRLDSAGDVERTPFSPVDPAWSWAIALADVPPIDGRPLVELLDWVARETRHELRFADTDTENQAENVILRGSLANATPLEALEAALATTDLEHVVQEDGVLLIRLR